MHLPRDRADSGVDRRTCEGDHETATRPRPLNTQRPSLAAPTGADTLSGPERNPRLSLAAGRSTRLSSARSAASMPRVRTSTRSTRDEAFDPACLSRCCWPEHPPSRWSRPSEHWSTPTDAATPLHPSGPSPLLSSSPRRLQNLARQSLINDPHHALTRSSPGQLGPKCVQA